jgi:hypothetical protein
VFDQLIVSHLTTNSDNWEENILIMSKIFFLSPARKFNTNQGMLTLLKVMYYLGYLPFSWFDESNEEFFQISNWKTFFILLFDFLLVLLFPVYFYFWHIYNIGKDFDASLLIQPSYHIKLNDGSLTTAMSQLVYVDFVFIGFWTIAFVGETK